MATNGARNSARKRVPPRVRLYTSPACHWCRVAKAYFKANHVVYEEIDIISDKRGRRDMVAMTGQYGVPVILVGEKAMVGWDKREFTRLYQRRGKAD